MLQIAARAVEHRLNADRSDYVGPTFPCLCRKMARYAGRRAKTFQTALGEMTLKRAYYHCGACQSGFCPRDRALGMEGSTLSPAVTRMVGLAAVMVSFKEAEELMRDLAGVPVGAKAVERTAEALGREIAADEETVVEASVPCAPTMYLGMDGTGVPLRASELLGRPGKQPDGSSKTREVKLVTVWSAEGRDEQGTPVRDAGSVTYSAAIESAANDDTDKDVSEFAKRVDREARRRGFDRASRRAVLGDGAIWIWNVANELFPGSVQIVDRYHAKEHLSDVAKAIYGADSDRAKEWARQRHQRLDEGKLDAVLAAVRVHAPVNDEARKCLEYIRRNRHRMRYPDFHAQGLCTSTGVVEAGCKVAIGTRLKRAGMHWTRAGADAIIALRCCKLSGRFEDFWERRAARAA